MEKTSNILPMQNYVRTRVSTIVQDIGGLSSGSVPFTLNKPSDVTVLVASDPAEYLPAYFVAAINRAPTTLDFDVVVGPAYPTSVKPDGFTTLHLAAGSYTLQWASFSVGGVAEAFGSQTIARLAIAIDA